MGPNGGCDEWPSLRAASLSPARPTVVAMGFTIPQIAETDSWGPSAQTVDADRR